MPIAVTGTFTVAAEKAEQLRNFFGELAKASQTDKGCIKYEFFEDVQVPGGPEPRNNVFTIIEEWADPESLAAHNKTEHLKKAMQVLKDL